MATDQNDRLLRVIVDELRGLRTDVRALAAPSEVTIDSAVGPRAVELREPATPAEPEPEPAKPPAKKTASPARRKR